MVLAIQQKNSDSIATLMGQGMRLLLNVDPNAVFRSPLGKNYTNYYEPVLEFGLQFFNGSGFLTGDNYPNLVTNV